MRRFRRSRPDDGLMEEIPLRLYLFDVLLVGEKILVDRAYVERRRVLEDLIEMLDDDCVRSIPCIVTESSEEARDFFSRAVREGHEGVILKDLRSPYLPGTRGRHWLKFKHTDTLDLVVVAAERGYGRRHRWFSDYYLAARADDGFEVVGKTFKGLSDEEFEWMTEKLKSIAVERADGIIRVRPEIVVEVAFNEIQRSPKYRSGFALRFARIVRIRNDKSPDEADTLERIREIFKSRMKEPSRQRS